MVAFVSSKMTASQLTALLLLLLGASVSGRPPAGATTAIGARARSLSAHRARHGPFYHHGSLPDRDRARALSAGPQQKRPRPPPRHALGGKDSTAARPSRKLIHTEDTEVTGSCAQPFLLENVTNIYQDHLYFFTDTCEGTDSLAGSDGFMNGKDFVMQLPGSLVARNITVEVQPDFHGENATFHDVNLAVTTACTTSLEQTQVVVTNDHGGRISFTVTFLAEPQTDYFIAVEGVDGQCGYVDVLAYEGLPLPLSLGTCTEPHELQKEVLELGTVVFADTCNMENTFDTDGTTLEAHNVSLHTPELVMHIKLPEDTQITATAHTWGPELPTILVTKAACGSSITDEDIVGISTNPGYYFPWLTFTATANTEYFVVVEGMEKCDHADVVVTSGPPGAPTEGSCDAPYSLGDMADGDVRVVRTDTCAQTNSFDGYYYDYYDGYYGYSEDEDDQSPMASTSPSSHDHGSDYSYHEDPYYHENPYYYDDPYYEDHHYHGEMPSHDFVLHLPSSDKARHVTFRTDQVFNGLDTRVWVAKGACSVNVTGSDIVAANDDRTFFQLNSEVEFTAEAGTDYFLVIGGWDHDCGPVAVNVSVQSVPQEGTCENPKPLGFTAGSTSSLTDIYFCNFENETTVPGYTLSLPSFATGQEVSISAFTFDTLFWNESAFSISTGCLQDEGSMVAQSDPGEMEGMSSATFTAARDTSYLMTLEGPYNGCAVFDVAISNQPGPLPRGTCPTPHAVTLSNNMTATLPSLHTCKYNTHAYQHTGGDYVFLLKPEPQERVVELSVLTRPYVRPYYGLYDVYAYQPMLAVLRSCRNESFGNTDLVDNALAYTHRDARLSFTAEADTEYFIVVDSVLGDCGTVDLVMKASPPRPPAACSGLANSMASLTVTMDLEWDEVREDATFQQNLQRAFSKGLYDNYRQYFGHGGPDDPDCGDKFVQIALSQGSVVAQVSVDMGDSTSTASMSSFKGEVMSLSTQDFAAKMLQGVTFKGQAIVVTSVQVANDDADGTVVVRSTLVGMVLMSFATLLAIS